MPILAEAVFTEVITDPVPGVGVTISGLDPAAPSVVTLYRQSPGRAREVVPGVNGRIVFGADFFVDYSVPLSVPVKYTFDVDGIVAASSTIQVDSDVCWLQDPVNPFNSTPLGLRSEQGIPALLGGSFDSVTRTIPAEVTGIMGGSFPVALGGTRQAPSAVPLRIETNSVADSARLRSIFDESYPVMLRTVAPITMVPAVMYLHAEVTETPQVTTFIGNPDDHWIIWDLTVTVVRPPTSGVLVARLTYQDIADFYAGSTYADMVDGRTYLDWQKAPLERADA